MTHLYRYFLLVITAFFLSGCDQITLNPVPATGTILAFGDSLTYGVGVENEDSYPAVLATLTRRTVINAGISGETTKDGLTRFEHELDEAQPHLVILLEGGNDILRGHNLKNTKQNLAKMIKLAHQRDIQVLLIGVPEKKLFSTVAKFYPELATEHKLVFADSLISSLLRSPEYKSDPIHFNEQGYKKMAHSIYDLLVKHKAI
jgi:acyl-CoA thioesterase-1